MEGDDEDSGRDWTSRTGLFIAIWLVGFLLFLLLPCLVSKRRRRLWLTRIKERRWHVRVGESEEEEPSWYIAARERYEAARARAAAELDDIADSLGNRRLSKEEEESIREEFLLKQLSTYSTTLTEEDFKEKLDVKPSIKTVPDTEQNDKDIDLESGEKRENTKQEGDDIDTLPVNVFEESNAVVAIPHGGVCGTAAALTDEEAQTDTYKKREVPNGCAICLSNFSAGEVITWAANEECSHAFHNDCILNWLLSVGRKKRRHRERHNSTAGVAQEALNFPMLCPCCRQQFVSIPEEMKSVLQDETVSEESTEESGDDAHGSSSSESQS